MGAGCGTVFGPYKLENVLIDGYDVVVNRPKATAYRAPGGTNAAFAGESVVDELAQKLGIDPLEFRLRNAVQEGDRRPTGRRTSASAGGDAAGRGSPSALSCAAGRAQGRGRGVAAGMWCNWGGKSSASAAVNADGTVNLVEGSTDIGGSRASMAMQFAETLGIAYECAAAGGGDGARGLYGGHLWQPHHLWHRLGCLRVGQKITAEMCARAAELWDVPAEEVNAEGGVFSRTASDRPLPNWRRS